MMNGSKKPRKQTMALHRSILLTPVGLDANLGRREGAGNASAGRRALAGQLTQHCRETGPLLTSRRGTLHTQAGVKKQDSQPIGIGLEDIPRQHGAAL